MIKKLLFIISGLIISLAAVAQTTRYFEFKTNCGYGNWQDSSFVAASSDQAVIDSVLDDLSKPFANRKFIIGKIDYGNGGCNHNASHWFLWHFIPNQWHLAEMSVEVCDGCPYSDVDSDTAYWVGQLGYFCPWSSKPVKEVSKTATINENAFHDNITLSFDPATCKLFLKRNHSGSLSVTIYNSLGQRQAAFSLFKQNELLDVSFLQNGIYFLRIDEKNLTRVGKFMIAF